MNSKRTIAHLKSTSQLRSSCLRGTDGRRPAESAGASASARARAGRVLFCICVLVFVHIASAGLDAREGISPTSLDRQVLDHSTILPTDIPIELSAERLSLNYETNTYTARGNVTLRQGNTRLRADSISYEGNTGMLTAKGGVIARMGSDVIEAESISIKLADATGVMVNGKLLLTRQNVYLEGQKLEKVGESTYKIERGSFTTCQGPSPDWRITGRDLDVTLEGYGVLRHGFFYIRDVPVFYLPWMFYPAKRQRQTGFMVPGFSNSSLRGFDFRLPFFVNLGPSADITITPRVCTRRALQTALEFRYVPYEDFSGRFYGEYTYDWKYGPTTEPGSHRFYATWHHDQNLFGLADLRINGNWVSDRDYFEFWGGKLDKRKRVRYLESNAVVYRQTNNFLFQAEARYFDDLAVPDNAITVQTIPIVTGTVFNQQIPYTPFYLSSNVIFDNFFAPIPRDHWMGSRLRADTRLSLPIALGRYLKLEPSMTYFAKAYAADYYRNPQSATQLNTLRTDQFQVDADVFTDLYSVYNAPVFGFQRIKHAVRPRVGWKFRPVSDDRPYPRFDETDTLGNISLITAELRQTLTGRMGPGEYLDFLAVHVSQGYDLNKILPEGESAYEEFPFKYGLTNTRAELILRPHSLVDLAAQAEYDPVNNRARRYSVNMGLMDHRGDLLRVVHQFTEDANQRDLNRQTNVTAQLKVTESLDCFFENQYTHQFDFSYYTSVGLAYSPQCWNVVLKYSETREQDPLTKKIKEPDQTIFMTLSLYGLGEVYRVTQDWREILGDPSESRGTHIR
ncbi:MAG: LPS assembly protein LptD [Thermodesulfobacteriota bacterium]